MALRAILDSIRNPRRHPNDHGSLCARIVHYHPGHGPYLIRFEPGTGRSAGYLLTITPYIHNICRHVRVRFQRSAFRAIFKSRNMYRGGVGRRDSALTQVFKIRHQPFVGLMGRREAAPIYIYMLRVVTYNRNLNLRAF